MNANCEILSNCTSGATFTEVYETLGWTSGAANSAINRLISNKLLEKNADGKYKTTEKGKKYITENVKSEEDIVTSTAAVNLIYKTDFDSFFKIWRPIVRKYIQNEKLKEIGSILDDIYFETAEATYQQFTTCKNEYKNELARAVWCSFDCKMPSGFSDIVLKPIHSKNKTNRITRIDKINELSSVKIDQKKLFSLLWFFSLSREKRIKFNLQTLMLGNKSKK